MKKVFEKVIENGGFNLPEMLSKIDSYHISGKLTDEDRDALYAKARGKAQPYDSIDIYAKLADLEDRVRKLENGETVSGGTVVAEYMPGKWYYNGDKVSFKGAEYTCIAPDGVVCTWSPDEYPAYWSLAE